MNIVFVFEFFCSCSSPRRSRGLKLKPFLTLFVILFQDLSYSECVLGLDFGLSVYPRVNLGRLHNFLSLEEALIRVWELSRIGVREKSL